MTAHVYIQLPPGIAPQTDEGPQVWRLKKSLYGLSRAPKAFYDSLSKFLQEQGYSRSKTGSMLDVQTLQRAIRKVFNLVQLRIAKPV
jgi:hypothetical protein